MIQQTCELLWMLLWLQLQVEVLLQLRLTRQLFLQAACESSRPLQRTPAQHSSARYSKMQLNC